jgi:UDP-N-acetylenolpyruvoylglucosamine reductase
VNLITCPHLCGTSLSNNGLATVKKKQNFRVLNGVVCHHMQYAFAQVNRDRRQPVHCKVLGNGSQLVVRERMSNTVLFMTLKVTIK